MNSHNQHNENTPDKPQADASQLSEEQQALLTAEALGSSNLARVKLQKLLKYARANTVVKPTSWQQTQ